MFAACPAFAERSPSADQTISSLQPGDETAPGATRGVRRGPPPSSSSPRASVVDAGTGRTHVGLTSPSATPATETSGPAVDLTIDFATGSAQLTPRARETLDELGEAMNSRELANRRFRIVGHTDTVGTVADNRTLSERRAKAVVHYLIQKFGILPARLEAMGMGEAGLLEPTPPETPDPRNRRVRVVSLGA